MTVITRPVSETSTARRPRKGSLLLRLFHTTDHKVIGAMYFVTAFGFFMAGGAMAVLIRAELARPGLQVVSNEQYNQLFTMHGTIMLAAHAVQTEESGGSDPRNR